MLNECAVRHFIHAHRHEAFLVHSKITGGEVGNTDGQLSNAMATGI